MVESAWPLPVAGMDQAVCGAGLFAVMMLCAG